MESNEEVDLEELIPVYAFRCMNCGKVIQTTDPVPFFTSIHPCEQCGETLWLSLGSDEEYEQ